MPLKLDVEVEGQQLINAHVRVIRLWGGPDPGEELHGLIGVWANRNSWLAGKRPLKTFNITTAWAAVPVSALYDAVALLPEFTGAVTE